MIDRMDEIDGDPDLEDDEREPEWYMQGCSTCRVPAAETGAA